MFQVAPAVSSTALQLTGEEIVGYSPKEPKLGLGNCFRFSLVQIKRFCAMLDGSHD